jgi:hypothetical protein
MVPAQRREFQMSHNLNLAQDHAWHLAQTLMVPVVPFQIEGAFASWRQANMKEAKERLSPNTIRLARLVEPVSEAPALIADRGKSSLGLRECARRATHLSADSLLSRQAGRQRHPAFTETKETP